jgi:hypothetical protein
VNLPERIDQLRLYGLIVSDDGFLPTPTGPVHLDDSPMCRALLAHDDLLAACNLFLRYDAENCQTGETSYDDVKAAVVAAVAKGDVA